jgi:hypothetical protein
MLVLEQSVHPRKASEHTIKHECTVRLQQFVDLSTYSRRLLPPPNCGVCNHDVDGLARLEYYEVE